MNAAGGQTVQRRRFRSSGWLLCAALLSCESSCDRVTHVSLDFADADLTSIAAMTVGDSAQVVSIATGWWSITKFDSRTNPGAFRWVVADNTVATVSETGMVQARRTGQTDIVAFCDGAKSSPARILLVLHPVSAMEVIASATTIFVGDTVTLSVAAIDAEGRSIEGIPFSARVVDRATLLPLDRTQGLFTPFTISLQARAAGTATVSATNANVRPERLHTTELPIAVVER